RSYGDWSSDVCSSDLALVYMRSAARRNVPLMNLKSICGRIQMPRTRARSAKRLRSSDPSERFIHLKRATHGDLSYFCDSIARARSEERRVGKECRGGL